MDVIGQTCPKEGLTDGLFKTETEVLEFKPCLRLSKPKNHYMYWNESFKVFGNLVELTHHIMAKRLFQW